MMFENRFTVVIEGCRVPGFGVQGLQQKAAGYGVRGSGVAKNEIQPVAKANQEHERVIVYGSALEKPLNAQRRSGG
jgi:hypothetical protein